MRLLKEPALTRYGLTPVDPVEQEIHDLEQAQYWGLTRAEYMRRRALTDVECGIIGRDQMCTDSIMKTGRGRARHVTVLFLLKSGKPVWIVKFEPETQSDKYLMMRKLAHEVTRLEADAVILIGEPWRAKAESAKPYMRAADAADREELLAATLVRKEGVPVQLSAKFTRRGKRVSLGETDVSKDGAHFMFGPIYEAWGRSIPDGWRELMDKSFRSSGSSAQGID